MILKTTYKTKPPASARIRRRPKGLVGYWPIIRKIKDQVFDYGPQKIGGASITGNTIWTDEKFGPCLEFDAASGGANIGAGAAVDNLPKISVMAWVYAKSEGENWRACILSKRNGGGWVNDWFFSFHSGGTNALAFFHGFDDPWYIQRITNNNVIALNQWQHVAATWDGTNQATGIHIYVNSIECSYSGAVSATGNPGNDSTRNLFIGNQMNDANTWDGYISDVILYDRVIEFHEIKKHYTKPFWMFDRPARYLCQAPAAPAIQQSWMDLSTMYWTVKKSIGLSTRM